MQKAQGAGSIWNVNSWHWQSKNYAQLSKNILEQKFLRLVLEPSKQLKIKHTNIKFIKAEAEINIRKGKQILVYDFDIELTVTGQHESEDNSEGSYKIKQVINDNLDDIIVEDIKANEKNKVAEEMKKWLKANIKKHVIKLIQEYEQQIKSIEANPQKLEEDRKKREEFLLATQKARQQKGAQKQRLLQEQRERQRKAKQQAYKKTLQAKLSESK